MLADGVEQAVRQHGAQFRGHAGGTQHQAVIEPQRNAHRAANGIGDNAGLLGQQGLFAVGLIEAQVFLLAPLLQVLHRRGVLGQGLAGGFGQGGGGEVVDGGAEATVDQQHIAVGGHLPDLLHQAVEIVADGDFAGDTKAALGQLFGDHGGIGVDNMAGHQLVAGEK